MLKNVNTGAYNLRKKDSTIIINVGQEINIFLLLNIIRNAK